MLRIDDQHQHVRVYNRRIHNFVEEKVPHTANTHTHKPGEKTIQIVFARTYTEYTLQVKRIPVYFFFRIVFILRFALSTGLTVIGVVGFAFGMVMWLAIFPMHFLWSHCFLCNMKMAVVLLPSLWLFIFSLFFFRFAVENISLVMFWQASKSET